MHYWHQRIITKTSNVIILNCLTIANYSYITCILLLLNSLYIYKPKNASVVNAVLWCRIET